MPYAKDTPKAYVSLDRQLWRNLEELARERGFKSARKFVNAEIKRLGQVYKEAQPCLGQRGKVRDRIYQIPRHLQKPYANISCRLNKPLSTIVTFHLIGLLLEQAPKENTPLKRVYCQPCTWEPFF